MKASQKMKHATTETNTEVICGLPVTVKRSLTVNETYYTIHHPSGLDIYVIPKQLSTAYALFATRYGSIDYKFRVSPDEPFTTVPDGIAHFLEHKMFVTEDREDALVKMARIGADSNAYTSFDITAYLFSCTDRFEEALDLLLDFVTHPYFPEDSVEHEKDIIGQEIEMGNDNPYQALSFGMLQSMYEKHRVRNEIAGSAASIAEIHADLLYRCYHTFYNLHNMALCISGNVTLEQVIASANRILKPQPAQTIESFSEPENENVFRDRFLRKMQVSKPQFQIGIKDVHISSNPAERMKKSAAFSILENLLFGNASPFFSRLYEAGLITGPFGCWSEHNRSFSFISFGNESDNPEAVYEQFVSYIDHLQNQGIDPSDFERCRRVLYAQLVKSFDSTEDIANNFLDYVFDDCDIFDFADVVADITTDDVEAVLCDVFRPGHYTLAVIAPLD